MRTIQDRITEKGDVICHHCSFLIDGAEWGYHCLKACSPNLEKDTCLEYLQKIKE